MEHLKAYNQKLLANILPEHVAAHFLSTVNSDVSSILSLSLSFLYKKSLSVSRTRSSFANSNEIARRAALHGQVAKLDRALSINQTIPL